MKRPGQAALATLPERRHLVQTQIWRTPFGVWALTRWRLGFHFFGEALWEWLTLCPKTGPFSQISHTFGMVVSLSSRIEPTLYHKSPGEASYAPVPPPAPDRFFRPFCPAFRPPVASFPMTLALAFMAPPKPRFPLKKSLKTLPRDAMIHGPLPDDIPPGGDFPQMWKILWKN